MMVAGLSATISLMDDEPQMAHFSFGEALRLRRIRAGFAKQKDLADLLNVDPSVISRLEKREEATKDYRLLSHLSELLDAPIDDLVAGRVPIEKRDTQREPGTLGELSPLSEFPRLRWLLSTGWAVLTFSRKKQVVDFIEFQVQEGKKEAKILGHLPPDSMEEEELKEA